MGLILRCYTCATAPGGPACREERKRRTFGLINEIRNAFYSLKDYQRKREQGITGEREELDPKRWPCLGRQSSVFSALLLINLLPSCLLQAALPHLLRSVLVKNDSASRFHLWKCLPGPALLLPYFSEKPAPQPCSAERESNVSAETPRLSAVRE